MQGNLQVVVPNQSSANERTVLWVSELPENITEMELETFFQEFKDSILIIQINRSNKLIDPYTQRNLTATVIFKDNKRANEARKGLNLRKIRGKTIRIMWHEKDNKTRYNIQGNIFVKNIPYLMKPREFYEKFAEFGDIISAKFCEDEEGNPLGYGYVNYYNKEDSDRAIKTLNEQDNGEGGKFEVCHFQKKNERFHSLSMNKNLYVKNIPENYTENNVKELFSTYGNITWTKVYVDEHGRKSAIVSYDNDDSANRAKELNDSKIDGNDLYVDTLQKKSDRKKILISRISDYNYKLNSQFLNCNLHVRNLPVDMTEEELYKLFSKYGEIKSVKIPKVMLVTKVNNEFKESPMSKGFGYICFLDQEAARLAKEEMNEKLLPDLYPNWKRPLLIDFFMPKYERVQVLNKLQQQYHNKQIPIISPYGNVPMNIPHGFQPNFPNQFKMQPPFMSGPFNKNAGYGGRKYPKKQYEPRIENKYVNPIVIPTPQVPINKVDDPDIKYLQSLEDESSKRDYLGEFLFKKIENHQLALSNNFTIDIIGKVTGMILGIEDINEIIDITLNNEHLTTRITEAINILESQA
jgi:polyadenylate-binding protein